MTDRIADLDRDEPDLSRLPAGLRARLDGLSARQRRLVLGQLAAAGERPGDGDGAGGSAGRTLPATAAQEHVWLSGRTRSAAGLVLRVTVTVSATHEAGPIGAALTRLTRMHPALRQRFSHVGGSLSVTVPEGDPDPVPVLDTAESGPDGSDAAAVWLAGQLDPAAGRLLAAAMVRRPGGDTTLELAVHHLAADGWSLRLLAEDFAGVLSDIRDGRPGGPPGRWRQADLLEQEQRRRGDAKRRLGTAWRDGLAGLSPTRLAGPGQGRAPDSPPAGTIVVAIPPACLRPFRLPGAGYDFAALAAAAGAVVGQAAGRDDVGLLTLVSVRPPEFAGVCGTFIRTVPLRLGASPSASFGRLHELAAAQIAGAADLAALPDEEISAALGGAGQPVSNVLCAYQEARTDPGLPGMTVAEPAAAAAEPVVDVTLEFRPASGGGAELALSHRREILGDQAAGLLARRVVDLLGAAAARPTVPIGDLAGAWTTTAGLVPVRSAVPPPGPEILPDLAVALARAAAAAPDAVAVVAGSRQVTARGLHRQARALAGLLNERGIGQGDVAAIAADPGPDLVASMIAAVHAGVAHLLLAPATPPARATALADGLARVLIAPPGTLTGLRLPRIDPRAARPATDRERASTACASPGQQETARRTAGRPVPMPPAAPAYVVGTSGSTGTPRRVLGTRRSVVSRAAWFRDRVGWAAGDRAALTTPVAFVDVIAEVYGALLAGLPLVVPEAGAAQDPPVLARALRAQRVTVLSAVPTLWRELAASGPLPGVRVAVSSGEPLTAADLVLLREAVPRARLLNVYGCSEAGADSCAAPLDTMAVPASLAAAPAAPAGHGLDRVRVTVCDSAGRATGDLVAGEVYLAGAGLAVGYWADPGGTADRFVPDPAAPGERRFRTGDRAVWQPGQGLVLMGRRDDEVKIRGQRVRLGEVEAVLRGAPAVRAAAVVRVTDSGGGRLAGFVLLDAAAGDTALAEVRAHAATRLPEAWVPRPLTRVAELPTTPSGKTDRRALGALAAAPGPTGRGGPPRDGVEHLITGLVRAGLPGADPGRDDDLFDIGLHSVTAARLVEQVRQATGAAIGMADLFAARTVAGLAAAVGADGDQAAAAEPVKPVEPDPAAAHEPFPLTAAQQAYWVGRDSGLLLGGVATHSYTESDIEDLDLDRFAAALNRVVERHPALRTVVLADGSQQALAAAPRLSIPRRDLRAARPDERAGALAAIRAELSHQVLPTDRFPMFDIRATLLPGGRTRLHVSLDALICDVWSYHLVLRDLEACYLGEQLPEPPTLTFRDVVTGLHGQRRSRAAADLRWWSDRMPGLPAGPELPRRPQPPGPSAGQPPRFARLERRWTAADWQSLQACASRLGVTASALMITVFAEVLRMWASRPEFSITLTVFDRPPVHPDIDRVVGDFTDIVPVALPDAEGGLGDRARAVTRAIFESLDHRGVSGVEISRLWNRAHPAGAAGTGDVAGGAATPMSVVVTSTVDLAAAAGPAARPGGMFGQLGFGITQTPQVLLDCQLAVLDGELSVIWDHVAQAFPDGVLADMWQVFGDLLDATAAGADWPSRGRPMTLPARQRELRRAVNSTARPFPPGRLDQLALAGMHRDPGAPAVITPARRLSHGELEAASARVGTELLAAGVRPGDMVAIFMHKGWEQVVAALAVSRAGAAWVPVDPGLPAERAAFLTRACRVTAVCSQQALVGRVPAGIPRVLAVDTLRTEPGAARAAGLDLQDNADDLAYVIFTSGSTGTPKGVAITHQAAANTIQALAERFGLDASTRVLGVSSLSFDLSVWDIYGTLAAGGCLVLPDPGRARDPRHWIALVREHAVTVWNSVPALMNLVADRIEAGPDEPGPAAGLPSLRLVMLSGDWIPVTLPDRVRALADRARVYSLGGATEASIWSVLHPTGPAGPGWTSVPYGRPLANQTLHVLDASLADRPEWVPGELFIGGTGLATGYWDDPALTAARFIVRGDGQRLYRTGDVARYRPGGDLEFLGREDSQVKINGHRVELGEIEYALARLPSVRAAVVEARGDAQANARKLAAYIVPEGAMPTVRELRAQLASRLPGYAVPSWFVRLDAIPLTANGKVDRKALPPPSAPAAADPPAVGGSARDASARDGSTGDADRDGPILDRLGAIWAEVLGVTDAGRESFFDLGGTSVDALTVVNRVEAELGVRAGLADILSAPTLAAFADRIAVAARSPGARGALAPGDPLAPFPLTAVQMSYWIGRRSSLDMGGVAAHTYAEYDFRDLDLPRLERTIDGLVRRHGMLRTVVGRDGMQRTLAAVPPYRIVTSDLRDLPPDRQDSAVARLRARMSHAVRDPGQWPLFELRAHRLDDRRTRLYVGLDLLIADAESVRILMAELDHGYARDSLATLPPLRWTFRDFVRAHAAFRAAHRARDETFWRPRVAGLPAGPAISRPRLRAAEPHQPPARRIPAPSFRRRTAFLDEGSWAQITRLGTARHLTPSAVVATAFAEILREWSGTQDFVITLTTLNRPALHPDVAALVGDFTSTTLVRATGSAAAFGGRARDLQQDMWEALDHDLVNGIDLGRMMRQAGRGGQRGHVVLTSMLRGRPTARVPGGLSAELVYGISQTPQVLLDHQAADHDGRLGLNWDYLVDRLDDDAVDTAFARYLDLLSRLTEPSTWDEA